MAGGGGWGVASSNINKKWKWSAASCSKWTKINFNYREGGPKVKMHHSSDNYSSKFRRQSYRRKFISILPGGYQEFSNGHIKCHECQHFLAGCSFSCDPTVLDFHAEDRSSSQNTDEAISCDLHDFCTFFSDARLAVTHWPKFWSIVMMHTAQMLGISVMHWSQIWCIWHPFSTSEACVCA